MDQLTGFAPKKQSREKKNSGLRFERFSAILPSRPLIKSSGNGALPRSPMTQQGYLQTRGHRGPEKWSALAPR